MSSSTPATPHYNSTDLLHDIKKGKLNTSAMIEAAAALPNKSGIALWFSVAASALFFISSLGWVGQAPHVSLGFFLIGAGIALACGWALYCRSVDKKTLSAWKINCQEQQKLHHYLTDEDRLFLGDVDSFIPPMPKDRHWKIVGIAAAVLFFSGFAVYGSGANELPAQASHLTTAGYSITTQR